MILESVPVIQQEIGHGRPIRQQFAQQAAHPVTHYPLDAYLKVEARARQFNQWQIQIAQPEAFLGLVPQHLSCLRSEQIHRPDGSLPDRLRQE